MSKIILIGSPNSGKSLLFNRLTGMHQKVANFPGITVDIGTGKLQALPESTLVDFPGTYSLQPISGEEQVAVDYFRSALDDPDVSQVLCLIDATRLEKSLYFTLQVIRECARHHKHVTVLANMMDVLDKHKIEVDLAGLSSHIKAPVLPISARTGNGVDALLERLRANHLKAVAEDQSGLADTPDELLRGTAHQLASRFGPKGDILIKSQARLDEFFLHSTFGGFAFFGIMYLLFQSIFTWAAPMMDGVEALLGALSDLVLPAISNQMLRDFNLYVCSGSPAKALYPCCRVWPVRFRVFMPRAQSIHRRNACLPTWRFPSCPVRHGYLSIPC
jgi:ferrous iron transport protein B